MIFHPLFILILIGVATIAVGVWCLLCFRVGAWIINTVFNFNRHYDHHNYSGRRNRAEPRQPNAPMRIASEKNNRDGRPYPVVWAIGPIVIGLLLLGIRSNSTTQPTKEFSTSSQRVSREFTWRVPGYGKNPQDAEQCARENAYGEVLSYLKREMPQLHWTPSPDYVGDHLLRDARQEPSKDIPELGLAHQVSLLVDVGPETRQKILREDRHYRSRERMAQLAAILGALVAGFTIVSSYIRLDEASKGYYSGWLRVAAWSAAAAAALIAAVFFA